MVKSLPPFVNDYLNQLLLKGKKASTIKRYEHDLFLFFRWLDKRRNQSLDIAWKQLELADIKAFISYLTHEKKHQIRTIRRIHSALKQLSKYSIGEGFCSDHVFRYSTAPELVLTPLESTEWVSRSECITLLHSIQSNDGLSEQQIKVRPFLIARNQWIVYLFLHYGFTLQEVTQLTMKHIHFEHSQINLDEPTPRMIHLHTRHRKLAFHYYQTISDPLKPRLHSDDPYLVAFDFKRKTFRWSYEDDSPKRLTNIAIQKMLRVEAKRAGLRSGISAQHLRNRFVLRSLLKANNPLQLQEQLGFQSLLSFQRYILTLESLTPDQKLDLLEDIH
ncbi:tyrosine-type recombinase/integrase [Alkalihalobacillus pseudalcaliphilus]|uniref:tyrosine-type recombinase/integrase n=1 Tax=Alkalihalobacillus pseudalcaliphilus TaxID=79884 RepID=UPI00064D7A46|nr:phage integrase N-terminal SAM-like domain-containing protein [Alkalihalobacillus pseudalcaliphilus]KMK76603.1 hypothetical protein AB990_15685 [Alkalihalobacillus pseudalcaliphilus]